MTKKKARKSSKKKFLKKSSLTTLILILLTTLFKLGDSLYTESLPTELPSSQAPLLFYANQQKDDLSKLYIESIKSAKQSVTLVIYSLLDQRIIAALRQKANEGVKVYIVCDAKASVGISRKLPEATIVKRLGKGLMHQKILIIDNQRTLIGSANMTHSSLQVHGNLVMGLDNAALAKVMNDKAHSMDDEGNSIPLKKQVTHLNGQTVELWELPDTGKEAIERVLQLLRSAKKSIRVAMFTWTRKDFTQELINAKLRGVKVEAVIDRYSGKGASAKVVQQLLKAKIAANFNTTQGLLHYKFAYIDENIVINGSTNWTEAAFKSNDDLFLVIYPLTIEQKNKLNQLWKVIWKESASAK